MRTALRHIARLAIVVLLAGGLLQILPSVLPTGTPYVSALSDVTLVASAQAGSPGNCSNTTCNALEPVATCVKAPGYFCLLGSGHYGLICRLGLCK